MAHPRERESRTTNIITQIPPSESQNLQEFRAELRKIKPAIEHHYQNNRHHPEYFGNVGIAGMTLHDLMEMTYDRLAAAKRKEGTDILKSLQINKTRFDIDDQLFCIIMNTITDMLGLDNE